MSLKLLSLLIVLLAAAAQGQLPAAQSTEDLKGQVRSAAWDRVYVRMNGRNIGERREKLNLSTYDAIGRLLEVREYGNGYLKTSYIYSADKRTAEISHFDEHGNPQTDISRFRPGFDREDESGLCTAYTIRSETDVTGKLDRFYETCVDGSQRALTVVELGPRAELVRQIRRDAKSRSWETVCDYDRDGNLTEFRFTVNANTGKPYTHTVRYSDHRYDQYSNLVRVTATAFISTKPDELMYQFNEIRTIVYRDLPPGK